MTKLQNIQRICTLMRYLVIVTSVIIFMAVAAGQLLYDQWWVELSNGAFNELWQQQDSHHVGLSVLISPLLLMFVLGVYWLQKLFGVYQQGQFFTDNNIRCYLWLVWLKFTSFVYGILWPLLLPLLPGYISGNDIGLVINVSDFFTLLLMLCIVHVLKAAQDIHDENKGFV